MRTKREIIRGIDQAKEEEKRAQSELMKGYARGERNALVWVLEEAFTD